MIKVSGTAYSEQVLDVYLLSQLAGRLYIDESRKRIEFAYQSEYLASDSALPLSLSMPLQTERYADETVRPVFANLLPEGDIRHLVAGLLGLSPNNDFSLLEALGGECAGAISIMPFGELLPDRLDYQALDDDALSQLIERMPQRPMLVGQQDIRLSLAGAQHKLPIYVDEEGFKLPLGTASSNTILKTPIQHYKNTVFNEYFCMQLAQQVGLNVPRTSIVQKTIPLYVIDRYDRTKDATGQVQRLLQEDFCQALSIMPEQKYEKEGGPNLEDCFKLIRHHSIQPAKDLSALLRWVIFNYLIGNNDAHGKNISLMLDAQGASLAPFYDLMSTEIYPNLSAKMAMKIGGEARPDYVQKRHWERFAAVTGIKLQLVQREGLKLAAQLAPCTIEYAANFEAEHGEIAEIQKIVTLIEQRKRKLTSIFNG